MPEDPKVIPFAPATQPRRPALNGAQLPPRPEPIAEVKLCDAVVAPIQTIRRARLLAERVLATQGDAAERELIQLQHELSQIENRHSRGL